MTKTAKSQKSAPAPVQKKVAKPAIELYSWKSGHTGPSTEVNKNLSRTKIDPAKFNAFPQANVTARDQEAIKALRAQFGEKAFQRKNVDAGILRRLMERGLANCVKANDVNQPTSMFALTPAGLGRTASK